MLVFGTIAMVGAVVVFFGLLFGHDHDFSHDVGHDMGHDVDQGGTISIFSVRVIFTFIMGFGAAGFICVWKYETDNFVATGAGLVCGLVLAVGMYFFMLILARQQGSSSINLSSLIGTEGAVTVSIDADKSGEVGISAEGRYGTYAAVAKDRSPVLRGQAVKVVSISGSQLVVEKK